MERRHRTRSGAYLALLVLAAVTACATDPQRVRERPAASEERPPIRVSRTGIPVLMDLPVIGVLFRRTTVVR